MFEFGIEENVLNYENGIEPGKKEGKLLHPQERNSNQFHGDYLRYVLTEMSISSRTAKGLILVRVIVITELTVSLELSDRSDHMQTTALFSNRSVRSYNDC